RARLRSARRSRDDRDQAGALRRRPGQDALRRRRSHRHPDHWGGRGELMSARFIAVNQLRLDGNERRYLRECIDTGWISSEGPFVKKLETEFAAAVGRKWGVAVCNGSAALEASVAALRLGPGDEVIMPAFTIISCASAVTRAGAVPVLVDSDPDTWNMRVDQIAARITPRTRAIMVVHIYGLPAKMDQILELAAQHELKVIEDAAELHGGSCNCRPCGS